MKASGQPSCCSLSAMAEAWGFGRPPGAANTWALATVFRKACALLPSFLQLCFPASQRHFCLCRHIGLQPSFPGLEACLLLHPESSFSNTLPHLLCHFLPFYFTYACVYFFSLNLENQLHAFWFLTLKFFFTLHFFIVRFVKVWFVSNKIRHLV